MWSYNPYMTRLLFVLVAFTALASAGTLYLPAYPATVLVFDEAKGQIVARIPLTTGTGFSPRMGPNYLLYVSATATSESIWKLADGTATELWSGVGAQVFGGPAIAPDGRNIAFSVRQSGKTLLYVMQSDGTKARIVAESFAPGVQASDVARRHGVRPQQLFGWRREMRACRS